MKPSARKWQLRQGKVKKYAFFAINPPPKIKKRRKTTIIRQIFPT
jgi:hypothetical protein